MRDRLPALLLAATFVACNAVGLVGTSSPPASPSPSPAQTPPPPPTPTPTATAPPCDPLKVGPAPNVTSTSPATCGNADKPVCGITDTFDSDGNVCDCWWVCARWGTGSAEVVQRWDLSYGDGDGNALLQQTVLQCCQVAP